MTSTDKTSNRRVLQTVPREADEPPRYGVVRRQLVMLLSLG